MGLIVRTISEQDAAAVTGLSDQLGYSATVAAMAQRIRAVLESSDHCAFAAVSDGKVVGWIHGCNTLRLESDAFVEIAGLVVDERLRQQGIGQQLIEKVKEWAADRAIGKVRVRCNTKRLGAHIFYHKLGFKESKEQKVFDLTF